MLVDFSLNLIDGDRHFPSITQCAIWVRECIIRTANNLFLKECLDFVTVYSNCFQCKKKVIVSQLYILELYKLDTLFRLCPVQGLPRQMDSSLCSSRGVPVSETTRARSGLRIECTMHVCEVRNINIFINY